MCQELAYRAGKVKHPQTCPTHRSWDYLSNEAACDRKTITKSVVRDALEEFFDTLQVAQAVTDDNDFFFLAMIRKEFEQQTKTVPTRPHVHSSASQKKVNH